MPLNKPADCTCPPSTDPRIPSYLHCSEVDESIDDNMLLTLIQMERRDGCPAEARALLRILNSRSIGRV